MTDKKKDKNTGRARSPVQPRDRSDDSKERHPEQARAEKEEARTLKEERAQGASSSGRNSIKSPERDSTAMPAAGEKPPLETAPVPVVAVGASAGGLPALEDFFQAVSKDSGLAFVVITHTDPEHESLLPDLLKKKTRIAVRLIEAGMELEPDTVYLPPSDRDPVLDRKYIFSRKAAGQTRAAHAGGSVFKTPGRRSRRTGGRGHPIGHRDRRYPGAAADQGKRRPDRCAEPGFGPPCGNAQKRHRYRPGGLRARPGRDARAADPVFQKSGRPSQPTPKDAAKKERRPVAPHPDVFWPPAPGTIFPSTRRTP